VCASISEICRKRKEIPTVFKNGGKCPQRAAKDPYFSQIDAEEYLFYNSG
jgi:hypothetical protein